MQNSKKGAVLVYVMVTFAVLAILVGAVFSLVSASISFASSGRDIREAYLNAKSGIEYAKSVLSEYKEDIDSLGDFYIYGDIDGEINYVPVMELPAERPEIAESSQIYSTCEIITSDEDGCTFTITSVGKMNNSTNTLVFDDGYISKEFIPVYDSNPSNSYFALDLDWINDNGNLKNQNESSDKPVIFEASSPNHVNNPDSSNTTFTAPQMFFINSGISIEILNSHRTQLKADFFYFEDDIVGDKSHSGVAELSLNTNNSGYEIDAIEYGLVYFNSDTEIYLEGNRLFPISGKPAGNFYFYQNGIDLLDSNDISSDKLILTSYFEIKDLLNDFNIDLDFVSTGEVKMGGLYK